MSITTIIRLRFYESFWKAVKLILYKYKEDDFKFIVRILKSSFYLYHSLKAGISYLSKKYGVKSEQRM